MKKLLLGCALLLVLVGCSKAPTDEPNEPTAAFDELTRISFAELESKIANKESMVVYFGWVENCGDAVNFQNNYLIPALEENERFKALYVVDLDVENPEGLNDKTKRESMKAQFGVHYSPTFIQYEEGEVEEFLEWTPLTTDATYALPKADLDQFFHEVGYLDSDN
ncbi:MAG: hypothetical protein ACRDBX_02790 [Erysipelotrichaceae bacterium]